MVRETRYLIVRNLPENCTEQTVIEHFQRYGKIQSVKLQTAKDNDTDSTATVAFNDIKSAAKAHHAKNSIGEVTLRTDYWEGSTGTPVLASAPVVGNSSVRSAVYTSTTPASSRLASTFSSWTKGPSEDDGSSTHDKDGSQVSLPSNVSSVVAASPALDKLSSTAFDLQRTRGRDRIKQKKFGQKFEKCGGSFGRHGTTTSTRSLEAARSQSEAAAAAAAAVASSSAATLGQAAAASSGSGINNGSTVGLNPIIVSDTKEVRDLKESNRESSSRSRPHSVASPSSRNSGVKKSNSHSRSVSRSRSRSRGSRSSSRSSHSSGTSQSTSPHRSHTSSIARPQSMVGSSRLVSSEVKDAKRDNEERRPLGICVMGLPIRSTDSSLRDGLYHEYKKQGKVTTVQICGDGDNRCAIISFRKPEDAAKALEASQGKKFFGAQIKVVSHEGVEVDDADRANDIDSLDEYHVKSTRTLFVGNLEKETTTQDLIDKFKQFGDIIDVDIKRQGATTAFGFVQYADILSVVKALREMEGEHIGSNKIKLGFGKSMPTDCIWLDCLPSNTSTRLLRSTLDSYGEGVVYCYVDRLRNKGLVYFSSHEDAQRCVSDIKSRPHFMKKKLQIDFASRECQNDFFERMERTNQLRANERPDDTNRVHRFRQQRSFDSFPEDGSPSTYGFSRTSSSFSTRNGRSSSGSTSFRRGRQYPDASFPEENHTSSTRRSRRQEEYSQSGQFYNSKGSTDDYDAVLREYGHSQRERRERDLSPRHSADRRGDSQSRQSSRDQSLDRYEKERTVEIYNSRDTSPGSDHNSFHSESRYRSSRDEKYTARDRYEDAKTDKKDFDHHSRVSRNASPFVHNHSSSRSHDSDYEHRGGSRSQSPPTPIQEDSSVHRMYYNDEYKRSVEITDDYVSYPHSQKQKDSDDAVTKSKLVSIHPSKLGAEVLKTASKSRKRIHEDTTVIDISKLDGKLLRKSDKSLLVSTEKGKLSDKEKKHHEASRLVSKVHDQTGSPGSSGSHGDSENGSVSEGDLHHLHQEKHHILRKLQELNEEGLGTSEPDSPRSVSKIKSVAVKEALKLSGRSHEDRKLDEVGAKGDLHRRQGVKSRAADSKRESKSHLTEDMTSTREDKNLIDEKEESIGGTSDLDYSSDLRRMKKRRTESSVDIASVKGKGYRRPSSVDISDEEDSDRKSDHGLRLHSASVVTRVSCDSRVGSKSYGDTSKTAEVSSSCDSDVFKGGLSDKDISVIKESQTVSKSNSYFPNKDWNVDYGGTVRSPVGCFSPTCSDDHTQDSVTSGSFTEKSSEHLSSSSWQHASPLPHLDKDISYGEYGYFKDFTIPGNVSPDDFLSDDSLDGELLPAPGEPSVEERIRVIDEMLNMTTSNKSSDSSLIMSVLSNKDIANNNDNTALYSKFRIRKREGGLDGGNGSLLIDRKPEPSVIMQQVLSKKSILDQDFKRLEQMSEKYDLYSGREFLKTEVSSPKLVEPHGDGYVKPLLSPSLLISPSLSHPVTTSSSMLQPTVTTSVAGSTSSFSVTSSSVLTTSVVSAPITTCSIHTLPKLAALEASKRLKVKPSESSMEVSDKHSICTNVLMLKPDIVVSSSPSPSPSSSFPVLTFTNNSLTLSVSQSVSNSLVGTLTVTETTTSQQSCKFAVSPSPLPPSLLSSASSTSNNCASSTPNSCVSSTIHPRTTLQHSVLMSPYITSLSSSSSLSVTQSTIGGAPVAAPFTQGPDKAQLTPIVGQEAPRLCSPSFTPENSRTTVSFHLPGNRSPRFTSHAADNDQLQKTNSKTDLKVIVSTDGDSKTDELKANTGVSPDIESPVSVQSETSSIASVPLSSIDSKSSVHLDEKPLTILPVVVSQCITSQHASDAKFSAKNSDSVKTELVSPDLDTEKTVAELCEKNQQNLHDNVVLFETIKAADILVSREIKPSLPLTSQTVLGVSTKDHSEKQHSVTDLSNSKGKLCSASALLVTDVDAASALKSSSTLAPPTTHPASKPSVDKNDKKVSGKLNSNSSKMAGASVKSEALFAPDVKMEQIVKASEGRSDPRHHPVKGGASSKSSSSDRKSAKAPPKDVHDTKEVQSKESDKAEKKLDTEHKSSSLHESTSKNRETHKGKDKRDRSKDSDKGRPKDKEDKKKEERKTSEKKPEKKLVTTKDDKKGEKKVDDRKDKNSDKTKVATKSSQAKHSKVESNGNKQDKKQKEKVKDVKDKSGDKKVTTALSSVSAKAQSTHEMKPDSKLAQRADSTETKSTKHDAVKDSSLKSQKDGVQKSEASRKNEQKTKHKSDVKGTSKGLSEAKSDSKESLTSTPVAKKPPQVVKPKKGQDKGGSKQSLGKQSDKFLKSKQAEDEKLKDKQKIKEEKERQKDKEKEDKLLKEQEEKEKQREKEEKERIEQEERERTEKEAKLKEERERQKEVEREEMEREQLKEKEEKEQKEREREERERQKEKEEKERQKEKEEKERQKEKEKEEKEKQKEERERQKEKEKEERERQKEKEKEERERQKEKEKEEKEKQKEKEREERERHREKEKEEKQKQKEKEREEKERQKEKEREEKERQKEKEREERERQKKEREEKERQKEKEKEEKERQKQEREEKERQKEKEREEKERQKEKEKEEKERQKQEREERERQMEKEREEKERQKEKEQKERQKEKEEKERKDREEKMRKEKEEKQKQKDKDEKEILKEKEKTDRKLKNKEEQKDKIKKEKMKDIKPDKKGKEKKVKEDKSKKEKEDKFRKEKDKNKKDKEEKEKANRDKERAEKERKEKEEKEKKKLAPKKPKRNELAALLEHNDMIQMSFTSMYDRVKTQRNREPDPQHKSEPAPKSSFDKFKQKRKKNGGKVKSSFYTFDTSSDGSEDDGNADDDDDGEDLSDLSDHDSNLKNEPVTETKPKKPKQIKKRAHVSSSSSSCEEDDDALLSATKPKSQKTDTFNAIFSSDSDDDNFQPPSKLKSGKAKTKPVAKRRKTRDDSSDSLASRDDVVKPRIMSSVTDSLDDMDLSDEDEIKSKRKKAKAKPILFSDHDDRDSSVESMTRKAAKTDLDSSLESLPKTAVKADKEESPSKKTKPESKKVTKAHDSKVINKEGSKLHLSDKKKKKGEPEKGGNKIEPSSKAETGKQKPKVQPESKSVEKRKRKPESEKGIMSKLKAATKANVQTPKQKGSSVSTAEQRKPRPNHDKPNEEDKSRSKEDKPRTKEDKLKEEDKSRPKDDKIKEEDKSRPKDDKIKEDDKFKFEDDKSKEEDKSRSKDDKQREEDKSKAKDDKLRGEEDKSKAKDDKLREEDKSRPKDDKQREDKHRSKNDKPIEEKTKHNVEPENKSAAEKVKIESEGKPHVGEPRHQPEAEAKSDKEHFRAKSEEKQKVEVERTLHQEKNTAKVELDNKSETELLKMEVDSSSDTESAKSKVEYRHKSVEKMVRSKPGQQTKQDDEIPVPFVEAEVKSDDDSLRGARSESDDKSTSKTSPSNDSKSKFQAERKKKSEDKEDSAVKKKKKKKYDPLKELEQVDSLITKVYDKKKEEKRKCRLSIFDSEPEDSSAQSESSSKTVSSYAEKLSAKTEEVEPTKPKEDKVDSLKDSARSEKPAHAKVTDAKPADAKPAADEASKVAKKKSKKKKDKKEIADEIGDVMMKDQLEDKEKPDSEMKQEKTIKSEDHSDDEHVRPPRKKRKKEHDRDTDQEKEHEKDTDREKGVKVGRSPEKKSDKDKSMCFGNEDNANISNDKSSSQFVDEFTSFWGHPKPILIPKRLKDSKKSDDDKVKHKEYKDELKTGGNLDHSEASSTKDDQGDGREAKFSPSDDKTSEVFQSMGQMSDSSTKAPKLELETIEDLIVPISEAETTVVTEVASVGTIDSVSSIGASLLMQEESGQSSVVPDETTIGSSVEIDDDDFPSLIIDEIPESSEKKVTKKDKKLLKKQQVKEFSEHMDEVIASVAMALSSDDEDETSLHIDSISNDQELLLSDVINQELKYDKKISSDPERKTSLITNMLFANKEVKSRQLSNASLHGSLQRDKDASGGSGVMKKEQERKKEVVKNFGQLDEETKKRDEELLKTLAVLCDPNLDRPVVIDDSKREPTPEDIKKKEEADKKKAEEEKIKLEEEKKKAEEEERRKVEEEKKRVEEEKKRIAEEEKKAAQEKEKAEAERKKAEEEEARRKVEEEKHRVEEEKRKAEEEKKRAEEEKKRAEEEKKRAEEEKKRAEVEEKKRAEEEEKRKAEEEKTRREKEEQALREASDEAARAVESLLEFQSGFDQEPADVDDDLPPLFIEPADKEPPVESVTMSPTADKNDLVSIFSSTIPDKVTANLDDKLLEKKLEEKGSRDQADSKLDSFGLFATPIQTVVPAPVLTSPRRHSAGIKEKTPEPVTSPHRPMQPSPQMHSPHRVQFPPQRPLQSLQSQMQSPPNQMQSPPNQMQSPQNQMQSPHNQMQSPHNQMQSPHNQMQSPQKASMSPQMDIHSPQPILHPQRSSFFSKDAKADRNFVLNTDVPPHSHVDILHAQQPQRRVSTTLSAQPILDQPLRPVQVSPRRKSQEFPAEQLSVSSRRNTITGPEDVSVTHLDRRFPPYMGSDIIFSKERTHSISSLPPPVSISLDHAPHDTNSQSPMQSLNIPSHQDNILLSPKKTSPVLQFKERTPDPPIFPLVANKSLQEPVSHFSKGLIQEQIFAPYPKCQSQEQLFYGPKSQASELFRPNQVAGDVLLHAKSPAAEKPNLQPNQGPDSLLMPQKSVGQELVLQHAKAPHHVLEPFPQHEKGLLPREQMFSPKSQPDNPFNYPDQNIDFLLNSPPRNNLTFPSFPQTTEVNLPPVAKQADYSQDALFIAAAEAGSRPGDREPSHIRRAEGFPASFYQEPVPSSKTHQDKVTISLQQHQSSVEDDKKGTRKRKRNSKKTTNEDRAAALAEQQAIEQSVQANVDSIRKALTANQAKAAAEKAHMGGSDKKKSLDAYDFEAHIGQDIGSSTGVLASDGGYSSVGETEAKPLRSRNERGRGRGYGARRGRRGRGAISSVNESAEPHQRPDSLPTSQPPLHFPVHAQNSDSVPPVQQHPLQQFALSQQQLPSFQRQTQHSQSSHQPAHAYSQSHPSPVSSENSSSLPGPDWHQKSVSQSYPHSHVAPPHQQTLQQPSVRLPLPKSDVLSSESNKQDLDLSYGESELIINLDDQPSSTEGKENQYSLSSDGEERSLVPSPSTPKSQRSTRARKQPDYKAIASGNVHTPAQPRSSRSGGSPRGLGNGANSPRSMSPRTRSTENMSSSPVVKLEKLEVGRTTRSRREIASKGKDNDIERAPPSATIFEDQKGKTGADESKSVSKENIYEFVDNEHEQIIETSLRSARTRKKRVSDLEFPLQQQQQPLPDYMPASPVSASNSTLFGQESRQAFEIHAPEVKAAEESPKLPHLSNVDAIIEAVSKGNFGSFEDDPAADVAAVLVPPTPVVAEPVTDHLPAPPPTRSSRRSTESKKEVDQKAEKTFIIAEPPRFEGREAGRKGPTVPPLRIKVAHGAKVEKSEEKHYVIERAKGPGSTTESEKPPLSFTVKLSDTGTAIIKSASGTTTPCLASPQLPTSGGKNQVPAGDVFKTDSQQKKESSIGLFSGLPQNEHHGSELDIKCSIAVSQAPGWKSVDALADEGTVSRPTGALHPKVAAKVQASQESQIHIIQTQASVSQPIQQYPPSSTASISGLTKSSPVTPATPHGLKHTWSSSLQQDSHHQLVMPEQAPSGPYLPAGYHQNLAQMSSPLPRDAQILHQQPQQQQLPGSHPESKQPPNAHNQPVIRSERTAKASKPGGMEMTPDLASKLAAEAPKHQQGPFTFPPHLPPAHSGQRPFIVPSEQPGHHAPHFPSGSLLKSGSDNRPAKSPSIQSQVASKIGAEVRTQTPPVTPGAMLYAGVVSGQPHSLSPSAASPEGQVIERIQNPIRQPESGQSQSPLGLHLPGSHHQDPVNRFMKDETQDGSGTLSGHTERTPSREIAMYQHMIEQQQQRLQQHLLIAEAARNSVADPARNIAVAMRNALESSRTTPVALEGGRKGSLPTSQAVGHGQPLNLTPQSDLRGGQPDPSRVTPKSTPPAPQSPFSMQYYERKGETGRLPATVAGSFMQPSPGGHREGLAPHIYQELSLANLPHSSYMVGRLPIDPRIYGPGQQAPPHLMREGVLSGSFPQAFPPGARFPGLEHPEGKKNDPGHPDQPGPHMLRSPSPIQRQMQADALRQQLTRMPCDLPTRDSPVGFLQRYPVMWQGALALKNDNSYVQMHFIAGNRRLPNQALPQPMQNGALPPLRISQRMRLEHAQLEGVAKRMQCEDHYCILIAVACGRDQMDINQQTRALNEGFITYLLSKQAAGIVNVPLPGSEQVRFVVHIFPPCEFVDNSVAQQGGVLLMEQLREVPHAVVIIATT